MRLSGSVGASGATLDDVMGLKPVATGTAVDRAPSVAPSNEPANGWRDRFGSVRGDHGAAVLEPDHLHRTGAEQFVEGVGAHSRAVLDLSADLAAGAVGSIEVDEDGDVGAG